MSCVCSASVELAASAHDGDGVAKAVRALFTQDMASAMTLPMVERAWTLALAFDQFEEARMAVM